MIDYVEVVRVESERVAAALEGVDPAAPVPCCEGWTAADLMWHVTEVQGFWAGVVESGAADPESVPRVSRPASGPSPDLLREQSRRLVRALGDHDPAEPCWSWSDDHTVGFVRRRQAHEVLIHRVDAEATAHRSVTPINSDLAADGVDEVLVVMMSGVPEWGEFDPDGLTVRIEAPDAAITGRIWGLAFGRFVGTSPTSGIAYDADAITVGIDAADPDTIIRGSSVALDLWLWGRGPLDALEVIGDPLQAQRLRRLAAEDTQ